ncbi:MAG: radical SAM protein [Planctomycetes bacterium]|nr:radical SAM protein [Planctomycetota bacterium]
MLILEVTHKCNLRCTYCIYTRQYQGPWRGHGDASMPWEVAKRAVLAFLDGRRDEYSTISFYGGEPLLEFDLVKRVIALAGNYARERGVLKPGFHLTTNGTLLTDDVIHHLVANDVSVSISMDGAQPSHDRYRVFASPRNPKNAGSFATVMRNVDRFIELYPDYDRRYFQVTIAATNDIHESNSFFREYSKWFRLGFVNLVRDVEGAGGDETRDCGYGCRFVPGLEDEEHSGGRSNCQSGTCVAKAPVSECPDFCSWSGERREELSLLLQSFVEDCVADPQAAKKDHPLLNALLEATIRPIHGRPVTHTPSMDSIAYKCLPGSMRLFCSVDGNYYPCERGYLSGLSLLGNVWEGFDRSAADRVSAFPGEVADCNNCVFSRLCTVCPTEVRESQATKGVDGVLLRRRCEALKGEVVHLLTTYTSIMERNPNAFDGLVDGPLETTWLNDLSFHEPSMPPTAEELGVEELSCRQESSSRQPETQARDASYPPSVTLRAPLETGR